MNRVLEWLGVRRAPVRHKLATFDVRIGDEGFLVDLARVFRVVVYVWLALFLLSRYYMYTHALAHASADVDDHHYMANKCLTDERHRRIDSEKCAEHIASRERSLHEAALQYVIDNTYLCGYDACSVVMGTVFMQIGLAAVAAIGAGVALYLLVTRFFVGHHQPRRLQQRDADYDVEPGRRPADIENVRQRLIVGQGV